MDEYYEGERDRYLSEKRSFESKLKEVEVKLKVREDDLKESQIQLFETKMQLKEIQQSNAQKEKIALGKIVQDQKEVIERLRGEKERLYADLIKSRNELKDKASKRLETMEKERAVLEQRNESFQANLMKKVGDILEEVKKPLKMIEKCQNIETLLSTQFRDKDHLSVLQTVVVDRVSHKWRGIATFLKFSINKMDSIEHEVGREKKDLCLKMFSEWLKRARETGDLPRTLRSVCEALDDRDEKQVANELVATIQNA